MYEVNEAGRDDLTGRRQRSADHLRRVDRPGRCKARSRVHRPRRRLRLAPAPFSRASTVSGTIEFDKVSPVNMDDIEVPAFLRYRT